MSSPYPIDVQTPSDKQIYAMEQACIWLNRIDDTNTTAINISKIHDELWDDKENFEENYLDNHLETAIDDYVVNYPDNVQKLINTESIDNKVSILNHSLNKIMDRFGYVKPDKPSYDEIESLIIEKAEEKDDGQYGPNFKNI